MPSSLATRRRSARPTAGLAQYPRLPILGNLGACDRGGPSSAWRRDMGRDAELLAGEEGRRRRSISSCAGYLRGFAPATLARGCRVGRRWRLDGAVAAADLQRNLAPTPLPRRRTGVSWSTCRGAPTSRLRKTDGAGALPAGQAKVRKKAWPTLRLTGVLPENVAAPEVWSSPRKAHVLGNSDSASTARSPADLEARLSSAGSCIELREASWRKLQARLTGGGGGGRRPSAAPARLGRSRNYSPLNSLRPFTRFPPICGELWR